MVSNSHYTKMKDIDNYSFHSDFSFLEGNCSTPSTPLSREENAPSYKEQFLKSFGGESGTVMVDTPIGEVQVRVSSQYYKMSKQKRAHILLDIKNALESPAFVGKSPDGSLLFHSSFKRKSGSHLHLFSVVDEGTGKDKGKACLMTTYPVVSKKRTEDYLRGDYGELLYVKPSLLKRKKIAIINGVEFDIPEKQTSSSEKKDVNSKKRKKRKKRGGMKF